MFWQLAEGRHFWCKRTTGPVRQRKSRVLFCPQLCHRLADIQIQCETYQQTSNKVAIKHLNETLNMLQHYLVKFIEPSDSDSQWSGFLLTLQVVFTVLFGNSASKVLKTINSVSGKLHIKIISINRGIACIKY